MPYRQKTRKKISKSILSGLFAGAGSVSAFALGMVIVGSVSDNFGLDQSQDPGYTQQSGQQQADAGESQSYDAPPGGDSDEGAEGQGSIDGGPDQSEGPSDGEGKSDGGEAALPGNDEVATGDGQPGNQGNNGGNSPGDGNSNGGTGGSSGGGSGGGSGTLANEPGGDTLPEDANIPEEEIVADGTNPDGSQDGNSPPSDEGSSPENEGQPDDGQQASNGPSNDGGPTDEGSSPENEGQPDDGQQPFNGPTNDGPPEETLVVDNGGNEDEGSGNNRIMAEVMSVPEPGAASFLVLGMLGALGLARSRKNRN